MICSKAVTTGEKKTVSDLPGKTALITGISGQDGCYLAELLLEKSYRVVGTSRHAIAPLRFGPEQIEVPVLSLDLGDHKRILSVLEQSQPDEIYNLAARSSSSQLFDDPVATAQVNGLAVVGLLEAIRQACPQARFCQASSSEIFARTSASPQDESTPFHPQNAYGAAKLFAQNMVEAYRDRYGLFAGSAILFNHESPRRGLEYVTRKVTSTAVRIAAGQEKKLTLGDLDSRRDWGFAGDYVRAMWLMQQQPAPGDFVIATGTTHSVRDLCELAFTRLGLNYRDHVEVTDSFARQLQSVQLCGNAAKAGAMLLWKPQTKFADLIAMMVDADRAALEMDSRVRV